MPKKCDGAIFFRCDNDATTERTGHAADGTPVVWHFCEECARLWDGADDGEKDLTHEEVG